MAANASFSGDGTLVVTSVAGLTDVTASGSQQRGRSLQTGLRRSSRIHPRTDKIMVTGWKGETSVWRCRSSSRSWGYLARSSFGWPWRSRPYSYGLCFAIDPSTPDCLSNRKRESRKAALREVIVPIGRLAGATLSYRFFRDQYAWKLLMLYRAGARGAGARRVNLGIRVVDQMRSCPRA